MALIYSMLPNTDFDMDGNLLVARLNNHDEECVSVYGFARKHSTSPVYSIRYKVLGSTYENKEIAHLDTGLVDETINGKPYSEWSEEDFFNFLASLSSIRERYPSLPILLPYMRMGKLLLVTD